MSELPSSLAGGCQARVGATLCEKWRLERLIDVGGMAAVYAATHRNGHRVAIKMLHPDTALRPGVCERFLKEGYVANRIDHAGAVRVLDDDVAEDGAVFLVMELLEGETLQARIERRGGALPADDVLCVIDRVLDVLCAAHAQGILHRDVKPDNIFITVGAEVKLLDFGIARLREESSGVRSLTMPGAVLGTPGFLPPEQALGRVQQVDARSDVWAVGATMYVALSGRVLHEGATNNERLVLAATQPAPSLGVVAPHLPAAVIELVDRALCYKMEDRWQSAAEMRVAIQDVFQQVQGVRLSGCDHLSVVAAELAKVTALSGGGPMRRLPPPTVPGRASEVPTLLGTVASLKARAPGLLGYLRILRGAGVPLGAAGLICAAMMIGYLLRSPADVPATPASAMDPVLNTDASPPDMGTGLPAGELPSSATATATAAETATATATATTTATATGEQAAPPLVEASESPEKASTPPAPLPAKAATPPAPPPAKAIPPPAPPRSGKPAASAPRPAAPAKKTDMPLIRRTTRPAAAPASTVKRRP